MTRTRTPSLAEVRRTALASPHRLEIIGLFTTAEPLAISDMAIRMGRKPTSLYHHVEILEAAGILRRSGTRPKGKRMETLYEPAVTRAELEVEPADDASVAGALTAMSSAFRMAERDLEAALSRNDVTTEGPERDLFATRVHMRVRSTTLARVNRHLDAILKLLTDEAGRRRSPSESDRLLSLTLALLPLRGRTPASDPAEKEGRR